MPRTSRLAPLPNAPAPTEPISIELLRAWVRADQLQDEVADAQVTAILEHLRQAAREKVEHYTGRYFAGGQRLAFTFELSEPYVLPEGVTAESVSGFFTDLDTLASYHLEDYRKAIVINRELPLSEAFAAEYTVVGTLPAEPFVPEIAKQAILELAAEWYRSRESSSAGTISPELPVNYRVKLAELRTNVLL